MDPVAPTAAPPAEVERLQMLIDGRWVDARDGAVRQSLDPYAGRAWAEVPEAGPADVDLAVAAARRAFDEGPWSRLDGKERGRLMRRLATAIAEQAPDLAIAEVRDNGKLIREMQAQLDSLPDFYEYFAGWADKVGGEVIPSGRDNFLVYTQRMPVGVVAGITAWNSPLLLLAYKLAPALAAGCTFVCKPAEQTPVSTLKFARLFEAAGFPPGVLNVVTGDGAGTGAPLARHPGVDKVAMTGSTETGRKVAQAAGEHLARLSLELGGKSPNIVFDDADLDAAASGVVAGIFAAGGQTCVAGSRVLVHEDVAAGFADRLGERARAIRLGDPSDPATEMGPLAFAQHRDKVLACIERGIADGGRLVAGGGRPDDPALRDGLFVQPTVFSGLGNDSWLARNEVFGPVAMVIPFRDEQEAVALANDTSFGLAAGVWTQGIQRAHRVAHALRVGTVWINAYRTLTYSVPFGGFKQSGIGRENGLQALHDFTETKAIWVETAGAARDPFRTG